MTDLLMMGRKVQKRLRLAYMDSRTLGEAKRGNAAISNDTSLLFYIHLQEPIAIPQSPPTTTTHP